MYGLPVVYVDASYGPNSFGCHSFGFFEDVFALHNNYMVVSIWKTRYVN